MLWQEMPQETAKQLVKATYREAPKEACGFIMRDWRIIEVPNVHSHPQQQFTMDPDCVLAVMKLQLRDVRGVYHSHPKGTAKPSETDLREWHYNRGGYDFRYWIATPNNVYEWKMEDVNCHPVRRDGSIGLAGMAYALLAAPEAVRREG